VKGLYNTTAVLSLCASLIWSSTGWAQQQDAFNATINVDGVVQGGGSGYGGGQWYRYPNTGWYNQWFLDGPFNANGHKTIDYSFTVAPAAVGATGRVTIALNWTTDRWQDTTSPPLPNQVTNNPTLENQLITRTTVYDTTVTASTAVSGTFNVPDPYCPTWVSIDLKGANVKLTSGTITHQCTVVTPTPTPIPPLAAPPLKWDQPPIEYDPQAIPPVFCGWDEPAYVYLPPSATGASSSGTWKLVADDFRCLGSMPITSVHWWGSYSGWSDPKSAPSTVPSFWLLGFWSNVPAAGAAFSHPGRLLQVVRIPASQVSIAPAGSDRFFGKPPDACYNYSVVLTANQYFLQNKYLASTLDNVFWLSITALYTGSQAPPYPWGWKTRPAHWMDDAVTFPVQGSDIPVGYQPSGTAMSPIENSTICQQDTSYDMCFSLDTSTDYVKWNQPFTGLADWPHYEDQPSMATLTQTSSITTKWQQLPDLKGTGVDMDATEDAPTTWPAVIEADDFQCTVPGPLTGIDIWGSWYFDMLPDNDANNVAFTLSLHKDIPAPPATVAGYSRPGAVLWKKTFAPKDFTVSVQNSEPESYDHPILDFYLPNSDNHVYRYHFTVDSNEAFYQTGTKASPVTYWLSVQAHLIRKAGNCSTRWGWKTSATQWGDVAVYAAGTDANTAAWKVLGYPAKHPLSGRQVGLAFQLTTGDQTSNLTVQSQVADDWMCRSRNPITAAVWWGSYLGYNYQSCACQTQTAPKPPYYFWLSIWTDVPAAPSTTGITSFSRPGKLVWQYNAYDYDEVFVGFDKHPEGTTAVLVPGHEPVCRYSVSIPRTNWFYQPGANQVYWFSVVAVFQNAPVPYKWGWTNHAHAYNDDAVTTVAAYNTPFTGTSLVWTPLSDQTKASEDMSFMLFTDPSELPPN
jgi:hypothetical protein